MFQFQINSGKRPFCSISVHQCRCSIHILIFANLALIYVSLVVTAKSHFKLAIQDLNIWHPIFELGMAIMAENLKDFKQSPVDIFLFDQPGRGWLAPLSQLQVE